MGNELKPCPFCGMDAIKEKDCEERYNTSKLGTYKPLVKHTTVYECKDFVVYCQNCSSMGAQCDYEEDAVDAWNTRIKDEKS